MTREKRWIITAKSARSGITVFWSGPNKGWGPDCSMAKYFDEKPEVETIEIPVIDGSPKYQDVAASLR